MVIYSAQVRGSEYFELSIEVTLVPGLPKIDVIGSPDAEVKETALRVRSALRNCGFKFPRAKSILFDISPRGLKKSADGLDLALALGVLAITDQLPQAFDEMGRRLGDFTVYGDLKLNGEVLRPTALDAVLKQSTRPVLTGSSLSAGAAGPFDTLADLELPLTKQFFELDHLSHLSQIRFHHSESDAKEVNDRLKQSHDFKDLKFTAEQADLAILLALGQHHALFAGPSGSGKTTLVKVIHALRALSNPDLPFIEVHHTSGERALVGGGVPIRPGAMSRAHGGILFLDELLLFRSEVQEALREPLEDGQITLARGQMHRKLRTQFQLLAATNLCPCGNWTPSDPSRCVCSSRRRDKYLERWRGPFLDRFDVLCHTDRWDQEQAVIGFDELCDRFSKVLSLNAAPGAKDILALSADLVSSPESTHWSRRRKRAYMRVSQTLSDMGEHPIHRKALSVSVLPFQALNQN